ncbi:hypothetical protein HHI36_002296 [Cryptolaemus montrouzieri]|uniref:Uncharacterized protein n=1 Tax=Cryptolaemus montrouzieri TaxID=559131 RepID=A0ABD2PA29_9CUCU
MANRVLDEAGVHSDISKLQPYNRSMKLLQSDNIVVGGTVQCIKINRNKCMRLGVVIKKQFLSLKSKYFHAHLKAYTDQPLFSQLELFTPEQHIDSAYWLWKIT